MFPISDGELRTRKRPFINVALIIICACFFFYELTQGGIDRQILFYQMGLIPREISQGINFDSWLTPAGIYDISSPVPNWATIFTSMFLHADWFHFLFNMLFLWVFGDNIEDRFGHFKYLLFYLSAGAVAVLLHVVTNTTSDVPVIGASGAIAGILGAYILLFPYSRITALVFYIIPIRIPAFLLLGFWFAFQFISGLGSLAPSSETGGVAYWAHIGGFLWGIVIVILYKVLTRQSVWPGKERKDVPKYWRGRPL